MPLSLRAPRPLRRAQVLLVSRHQDYEGEKLD